RVDLRRRVLQQLEVVRLGLRDHGGAGDADRSVNLPQAGGAGGDRRDRRAEGGRGGGATGVGGGDRVAGLRGLQVRRARRGERGDVRIARRVGGGDDRLRDPRGRLGVAAGHRVLGALGGKVAVHCHGYGSSSGGAVGVRKSPAVSRVLGLGGKSGDL